MVAGSEVVGPGGGNRPGRRPSRPVVVGAALVVAAAVLVISVVTAGGDAGSRSGSPSGRGRTPSTTAAGAAGPTTTTPSSSTSAAGRATTTTASPTTTTTVPQPLPVTLAFGGDLLPHLPIDRQAAVYGRASGTAHDFRPMLDPMRPVLEPVDVAICHLEVPVTPTGRLAGYPSFAAPPELVDATAAVGYDGCSTASNHSLDQGRAGIAATLDRFDQAGLRHAGTARTAEEGATAAVYEVRGARIAHLSYAYGFNGYRVPPDAPWSVHQIDPARIRADAAAARAAGADLVVVSLHWGDEYRAEPSRYQRDVATAILPSPDIDLVIGHHAHVVQPIGHVGGTYVVWGLGNQLANQPQAPRRDGLTVVVTAAPGWDGRWRVSGVEAVPTWIELGSFRVLPVVRTLADPATPPALRAELSASYDRTAATVTSAGTPGVRVAPKP